MINLELSQNYKKFKIIIFRISEYNKILPVKMSNFDIHEIPLLDEIMKMIIIGLRRTSMI